MTLADVFKSQLSLMSVVVLCKHMHHTHITIYTHVCVHVPYTL